MKKINFSLKSIDPLFEKIEKLTKVHRILISIGFFVIILGAFIFLSFLPKHQEISKLEEKYQKLEKSLLAAKRTTAQRKMFKEKMIKAIAQFELARKALPEKKDIPSLLADISRAGQDAGLEFLLFKPSAGTSMEFFAEIPIEMKVSGPFHHVALFFDKLSRLSRIVNIRDIEMTATEDYSQLNTACKAVTYRFIDAPPPKASKGKKPPKTAKKKK